MSETTVILGDGLDHLAGFFNKPGTKIIKVTTSASAKTIKVKKESLNE